MDNKIVERKITPHLKSATKSVLLLGPRQVGKSTLMEAMDCDLVINLADEVEFLTHSGHPEELRRLIELQKPTRILIDEIQRLPSLLNTVQALTDGNKKLKFFITGSSARKLKRGGANLLPGRVFNYHLGPFVASEFNYKMGTEVVLKFGALPEVYLSKSEGFRKKHLVSYVANYLREEIGQEALVRNLDSFSRFLQTVVLSVSQFVDYTKLAKAARISRHACPRYFEILEETMVGYRIFPFLAAEGEFDLIRHPKFFLFDNGIYNGLLRNFESSRDRIGVLSEQLIFNQIFHSAWANEKAIEMNSFRTRSGEEIDFIATVDHHVFAIEVKTSDHIQSDDIESLMLFDKAYPKNEGLFIFHLGAKERKIGKVSVLPWQKGLEEIGL